MKTIKPLTRNGEYVKTTNDGRVVISNQGLMGGGDVTVTLKKRTAMDRRGDWNYVSYFHSGPQRGTPSTSMRVHVKNGAPTSIKILGE